MKKTGFIIGLICLLNSCQSDSLNESFQDSYKSEQTGYYDQEEQSNDKLKIEERKIIKTAELRFQVEDLKESTKKIEALTKKYEGFISSMNQTNSSYSINNTLSVRIPSEKLDAFILEIEKESIHTNYKRFNSQDVTEEYVDITNRLSTKKEVRDRYIEILRNKAKTVKDVLDAEEKIRVIQEEIESIEGRLKYLNNRTSLSTIDIDLYQEIPYVKPPRMHQKSFLTKLKEGFVNGWDLILDIAVGLVNIWPILLIFGFFFLMRKRIRNLFRRKT